MASNQDTEITLGTGKMLVLFFGLVALCAVFFGMGFSLGKTSVKPISAADSMPVPANPTAHPSAVKPASTSTDLTFYKAVEQKDADAAPATTADESPAPPPPADTKAAEPAAAPAGGAGYYVQVAAVTKDEDAKALVDALKKKQYSAFTSNNSPADKLFHVQVGPFSDIKDAEATRAKLVSDGYNPILKK
jgi:DedD protein